MTGPKDGFSGARWDRVLDPRRRLVLQGMIGASALALTGRDAFGQSSDDLSSLPRVALVIGNSRYKEAPLRNPGNDASAIAEQLKGMRFAVTTQLDAGRREMIEAIRAHGGSLAKSKGVGLFYFAGHGAQLAWRNYLIPVDAAIRTSDELLAQAVDMNALLDDLFRARNAMNVIIVDACRDNPFGAQVALAQRGLSQLDAPAGTLLAYATSPGNVAADGTEANGLYTGFLLKEIQVRNTRIEDVFKRVRLNVRRLSKGQQIPWESTSLEQDFYFFPPVAKRKLTPEELEKQFEEELEIWQRIRTTKEVALLEDYLRRYPSGKFSELAQFRLERLLALQEKPVQIGPNAALPPRAPGFLRVAATEPDRVAIPATNPYTRGTAKLDVNYQIGDSYTYSTLDPFSRVEQGRFEERVTEVTDFEVIYDRGARITDLLGNDIVNRNGGEHTPAQFFIYEYSLGKKWTTRFRVRGPLEGGTPGSGAFPMRNPIREDDREISFKVVEKESITVPAGKFDAWRVEGIGSGRPSGVTHRFVYWIAPDRVRRVLAMEYVSRHPNSSFGLGRAGTAGRDELVAYSQQTDKKGAKVASAPLRL